MSHLQCHYLLEPQTQVTFAQFLYDKKSASSNVLGSVLKNGTRVSDKHSIQVNVLSHNKHVTNMLKHTMQSVAQV